MKPAVDVKAAVSALRKGGVFACTVSGSGDERPAKGFAQCFHQRMVGHPQGDALVGTTHQAVAATIVRHQPSIRAWPTGRQRRMEFQRQLVQPGLKLRDTRRHQNHALGRIALLHTHEMRQRFVVIGVTA